MIGKIRSDVFTCTSEMGKPWLTLSLLESYICSDIRVPAILKTSFLVLLDVVMHTMVVLPALKNSLRAAAVLGLYAMKAYLRHLPMRVMHACGLQGNGEKPRCINLISPNQIIV